jgi:hypothetical protein
VQSSVVLAVIVPSRSGGIPLTLQRHIINLNHGPTVLKRLTEVQNQLWGCHELEEVGGQPGFLYQALPFLVRWFGACYSMITVVDDAGVGS